MADIPTAGTPMVRAAPMFTFAGQHPARSSPSPSAALLAPPQRDAGPSLGRLQKTRHHLGSRRLPRGAAPRAHRAVPSWLAVHRVGISLASVRKHVEEG